jgi:hypothetical protein
MAKTQTPAQITRDDWMAAVAETHASRADDDPSLLTYEEFCALMGVAYGTARKRLADLVTAGRAIRTTKRTLTQDGRCRVVVAFRLKKP